MRKPETWDEAVEQAVNYVNRIAQLTGHDGLDEAETYLEALWGNAATFGVEHVAVEGTDGPELAYLNTGDTYALTVACEDDGPLFATTWGDWYEQAEQHHCETENVIRCAYCGTFCDYDGTGDWRDVECSCGHLVGG
jgi:hypothetical protein